MSWRIGAACGVLQNGCRDKSSPMFGVPCANSGAPTLLNFPPNSVFQSDCAGSIVISHSSFHSAFLALCFIFSQAKSAVVGKFSCCFVFLFFFFPSCLPVVCSQPVAVLCSVFALTDLQPQFMRILVWELPANP